MFLTVPLNVKGAEHQHKFLQINTVCLHKHQKNTYICIIPTETRC